MVHSRVGIVGDDRLVGSAIKTAFRASGYDVFSIQSANYSTIKVLFFALSFYMSQDCFSSQNLFHDVSFCINTSQSLI